MRIDRLDLVAYGPFTDAVLDLSAPGLHLVVGANEAGKSTTLAAITDALYGIPLRTTAGFLHHMTRLEVGVELRDRHGQTLAFRRVKKAKDTLRAADGSVIPDAVLARVLGGVDRATFTTMFGITHDQLVAGGRDLVAGHGELGELLFGASTGSANLHRTLKQLEDRAAALFKPGGHNPRVNAGLSRYRSAATAARDLALRPRAHEQLVRQIGHLEAALQQTRAQLAAATAERSLLQLLEAVLPNLRVRQQLLDELAALRPLSPPLRPGIGVELDTATAELRQHREQSVRAEREVVRLRAETEALTVDQVVLDAAPEIGRLREQRGQHDQAVRDRPAVATQAERARARAVASVARLRPGVPVDDARASLELPDELAAQLAHLAGAGPTAEIEASTAARAEVAAARALASARQALDEAPPPADARLLRAAVAACRADGDLVGRRDAVASSVAAVAQQGALLVAELALHPDASATGAPTTAEPHPLDEVAELPVPSLGVLQGHDDRLVTATRALDEHTRQLRATREQHRARRDELARLVRDEQVPSSADLDAVRRSRDALVDEVERAIEQRAAPDADDGEVLRRASRALRDAVRDADRVADRLRTQAHAVARREHLEAEIGAADARLRSLEAEVRGDQGRVGAARAAWDAAWEGVPVTVGDPRQMRPWLEVHAQVVTVARRRGELQRDLASIDAAIDRHRDAVRAGLAVIGVDVPRDAGLATVLALAATTLADLDQAATHRQQLDAEHRSLVAAHDAARAESTAAAERRHTWAESFAAVVRALGLASDIAPVAAVGFVRDAAHALEQLDAADAARERLDLLDAFIATFSQTVDAVVARVAPDLDVERARDPLGVLIERLAHAEATHERLVALRAELQQHQRDAAESAQRVALHEQALARIRAEVGAADDRELRDAIARSEQVHLGERELARIEHELRRQSRGRDAVELEAARGERDEAALAAEAELLDARLEELRAQLDRDAVELGHLQQQLRSMDGSAAAADAAAEAQLALADVARASEEYVAVHLAALLLRDAVACYRERHQAPLLARACPWFARLTDGSFATLDTDLDARGQTVLEAVRPDGTRVPVSALSEGTRDQLFLALRLAAVALAAGRDEPMPLILDDLFVNFDEARTRNALEIFGELSAEMQAVLFTHHEHVAELAASALPAHLLTVHRLAARTGPAHAGTTTAADPHVGSSAPVRLRPVS